MASDYDYDDAVERALVQGDATVESLTALARRALDELPREAQRHVLDRGALRATHDPDLQPDPPDLSAP